MCIRDRVSTQSTWEFLALTFLAFGNSMPDIATGIAISKMGLSEMALTGAISEPLFSMLVGLGVSMLKASIARGGSIEFSFIAHRQAILPLVGLIISLIAHISFFIFNCYRRFHLRKIPAVIMLIFYSFFFGIIVTLTAILPFNQGHQPIQFLSLIHISEPTRPLYISYAVFCLKKKKKNQKDNNLSSHRTQYNKNYHQQYFSY
eukprot:TRINITY_DN6269_c0_g1_i14.p1 TRINITY_DN6269_c0_g1~~TRINITY_DN6269_c0_g1_i14.p1  ORF type:complete len:204 (-),score=25.27 TRINITY_DN6269_c0_g1_i14:51-662(-)